MSALSTPVAGAVRRHIGALRACVSSPADMWLVARMAAWAVWLPALKYLLPLPTLVRLAARSPRRRARHPEQERKIVTLAGWLYAPMFRADTGCMQRSLLAYRFLGEASADPRLVIGVRTDAGKFLAHAWVTVDGEPRGDSREWVGGFTPMLAFDAGGRQQPPAQG